MRWLFYRGISELRHPELASHAGWNYAILALATAVDAYSWRISYLALLAQKDPKEGIWDEIIGSKDPTIFTVFLEASAAIVGAVLAFLGIFLGRVFDNPYLDPAALDPVASILIGLLLTAVAILLGRESGALLVGERTNRAIIARVKRIIQSEPLVEGMGDLLTMQLGPDQVLLNVDVKFRRGIDVQEVESAIDRLEDRIRREEPKIKRIYIEADSLKRTRRRPSQAA